MRVGHARREDARVQHHHRARDRGHPARHHHEELGAAQSREIGLHDEWRLDHARRTRSPRPKARPRRRPPSPAGAPAEARARRPAGCASGRAAPRARSPRAPAAARETRARTSRLLASPRMAAARRRDSRTRTAPAWVARSIASHRASFSSRNATLKTGTLRSSAASTIWSSALPVRTMRQGRRAGFRRAARRARAAQRSRERLLRDASIQAEGVVAGTARLTPSRCPNGQ